MKKLIAAALLASMFLTAVSCEDTQSPVPSAQNDVLTEAGSTETAEETTEVERYGLPEKDFDGATFNILLRSTSWTPTDVYVEGETGDIFNDTVYARNRAIEEDCNIKIVGRVASQPTGSELNNYIQTQVLSGDSDIDLTMIRTSDAATLSLTGIFTDLLTVNTLDFNADCWKTDLVMDYTVAGRLYYAMGLSINAAAALNVCFFNKTIADSSSLGNLYELVNSGAFTYDETYRMSAAVAKDLDGDGQMTKTDQFGIAAQTILGTYFFYASGELIIDKDENDVPFLKIGDERSTSVMNKLASILPDKTCIFMGETSDMKAMFFEERSLFYIASLANAEQQLRTLDIDYGILPFPKYEEAQENYSCYLNAHNPCGVSIPITADVDRAAYILQALALYSTDTVIPVYYDICLSGKYLRDEESFAMLDIIFASWRGDLAAVYGWGDIQTSMNAAITAGQSFTSQIESARSKIETSIAKTIETYEGL